MCRVPGSPLWEDVPSGGRTGSTIQCWQRVCQPRLRHSHACSIPVLICQAICKADARDNGVRLETGPGLLGTGVFSYRNVIGLFRKVNHAVVGVTGHVGLLQLYFQGLDFPLELMNTVMKLLFRLT